MIVFLNGRFVAAAEASIPVSDRGFLYGDALFETIRCHLGRPFLWTEHLQRLAAGAALLRLPLPFEPSDLERTARDLLTRNGLTDAVLRLTVSRGSGPRGYSTRGALQPTLVLTAHPAPDPDTTPPPAWRLHTARVRLPAADPLTGFKTANKLLHILARAEAEAADADEALLLNTRGEVAEAAAANVFWWDAGLLCTPRLETGALAGVTRGWVVGRARSLGWECREVAAEPAALASASGVFLTLSSLGVVEVSHLDGHPLSRDARTGTARAAWREALARPPGTA